MAISVKRKRPAQRLLDDERFKPAVTTRPEPVVADQSHTNMPVDISSLKSIASDPVLRASSDHIEQLASLGHRIPDLGTVRIANGILLFTQETAVTVMKNLRKQVDEGVESIAAAKAVASLGNAVAKLSQEFRSTNDTGPHKQPKRSVSFGLGKPVALTQNNIYINDTPPKKAE